LHRISKHILTAIPNTIYAHSRRQILKKKKKFTARWLSADKEKKKKKKKTKHYKMIGQPWFLKTSLSTGKHPQVLTCQSQHKKTTTLAFLADI
jgi:zona occludens toxin (predicted ATPase)